MKLCVKLYRDSNGYYIAQCPSLPGCFAIGKTREEANQKIDDAIRGYIAALSDFVPERLEHEVLEV